MTTKEDYRLRDDSMSSSKIGASKIRPEFNIRLSYHIFSIVKKMLSKSSLFLSLAAISSAAAVPGTLYGLFSNADTGGCDLHSLSPSSIDNATLFTNLKICAGLNQFFPAVSAYQASSKSLIVAIGHGTAITAINIDSGDETALAPMPAYNDNDWIIGLDVVGDRVLATFQSGIYEVVRGNLVKLAFKAITLFPQYSQVAACATCGKGGSPVIFVADEGSGKIFVNAFADNSTTTITGMVKCMDLQYSESTGSLIAVANYQLYKISATTAKATRIGNVPDGSGYPRVNTLSPDGTTIAISDFDKVFTMSLSDGSVGDNYEWHLAPRSVGFFQWVS